MYARLTEAQLLNKDHPEDGMFIVESPKVIGRALDVGYTPVSVLVEQRHLEENDETRQVLRRYENTDIPIYTADFDVLAKLTGIQTDSRNALRNASQTTSELSGTVCGQEQNCHSGKCHESDQCGSHFPVSGSPSYGSSFADTRVQ